ncbi:zona pellucida sperm-binding protein 2 isoform 1 preproprotein [Pimephales promelas]|nr:zona pellucida sperm-binding protein 2 isoform 1 preproprotein [Pimephales promelas]
MTTNEEGGIIINYPESVEYKKTKGKLTSGFRSQFNSKLVNSFLSPFNNKQVNSFLSPFNNKLVNKLVTSFLSPFNKLVNSFLSSFNNKQFNNKLVNSFLSSFNNKQVNSFLSPFNNKLVNSFLSSFNNKQFNNKQVNSFLSPFNNKLVNKLVTSFLSPFNKLVNSFLSSFNNKQFNNKLVNSFLSSFNNKQVNSFLSPFNNKLVNSFLSSFNNKQVNSFLSPFNNKQFNNKQVNSFLSPFNNKLVNKLVTSFLSPFNKLVNSFLSSFNNKQFNNKLVNSFLSSFNNKQVNSFLSPFNNKLVNSFLSSFNNKQVNSFLSPFNNKQVNSFLSPFNNKLVNKLVNSFLSSFSQWQRQSPLTNVLWLIMSRSNVDHLVSVVLSVQLLTAALTDSSVTMGRPCIRDGQFVVVVARDVTLPRLSLDSVRLLGGNDPACSPVGSTPFFAIYQFPVTACGTSMMEDGGYVVYENRMTSSYEVGIGPLGSITRDSHFELLFQCRYSGTSVEALVVEVNTVPPPPPVAAPGPLRVELRLANGQCFTKGCAEGDEAYTSYYSDSDYPVTKVLREPVFVEVRVLERTDPNIVLMLGHCWATSTPSPLSLPQWDLLVDGCPYQDDRYLTTLVPVSGSSGFQFPTHYKRFIVKMFTFVDPSSLAPLQETIFIHCSTAVCHPSSGSCEQSCTRKRRDTPIKTISSGQTVVSSGEVNLVK